MAIARSNFVLFGTDESTLTSVSNNTTSVGGQVDVLGDNTSDGEVELYAVVTSTVAVGTVDIKVNPIRVTGQVYSRMSFEVGIVPINGTLKVPLGRRPAARYMNAEVKNNATGASATVAVLGTLIKYS